MILLLGLLLALALGFSITLLMIPDCRLPERLAWAYGLGLAVCTLIMFYLSMVGIVLSALTVMVGMVVVLCVVLAILHRRASLMSLYREFKDKAVKAIELRFDKGFQFRPPASLSEVFKYLLIVVLIALVFGSVTITLYWPPHDSDEVIRYDNMARVFFVERKINVQPPPQVPGWGVYPLYTPLVHTWVYLLGGTNPKFIYSLFYLALLVTFHYSLRRYCSTLCSLVFTCLLASLPPVLHLSILAYTGLPHAFFGGMGTIALYRWMSKREAGYLILSATLIGLDSWVQLGAQGVLLAALLVLAMFSVTRREFKGLIWLVIVFALVYVPWYLYGTQIMRVALTKRAGGPYPTLKAQRLWTSAARTLGRWMEMIVYSIRNDGPWYARGLGPVLLFFLVATLIRPRSIIKSASLYLLVTVNVAVTLATSVAIGGWISSGLRYIVFLYPLLLFASARTDAVQCIFDSRLTMPESRRPSGD